MKRTVLAFEGVAPDEVTVDLLIALTEVSEEHGLNVQGVGINWRASSGEDTER